MNDTQSPFVPSRQDQTRRFIAALMLGMLLALAVLSALSQPVQAAPLKQATATPIAPDHIVISEFRTSGPAGGNDEFVELFNPTGSAIDITGWQIFRSSAAGETSSRHTIGSVILAAGQHYLIAGSAYNGSTPGDVTATLSIADDGGIALTTDDAENFIDEVGMDAGSAYGEGTPLVPLSGTADQSYERKLGGTFGSCYDVNDNLIDFVVPITPSDPQNSSSPLTHCVGVPTVTPTIPPTTTETPTITPTLPPQRRIIINEVAWAGTHASPGDEWIELYNPGNRDVILDGWVLEAPVLAKFRINLTGVIPAKSYFLLERSDDNVIRNIFANQIYDGAIMSNNVDNDGEFLQLIDPSNRRIDTANVNRGSWPAGSGRPNRCSMERASARVDDKDGGWFTNNNETRVGRDAEGEPICGTPKRENWAYSADPTPLPGTRTRTPTNRPTMTRTRTPAPLVISNVVINEFLSQPRSDWNNDGKVDNGDAFIEIKNLSTVSVSVGNWWLDDQDGDSSRYYLPDLTLEPGAWAVFFTSQTQILLSTGGDTVRLFKSDGRASDAFTYSVIKTPNQTWCRLPDGGQDAWTFGCIPTIQASNRLAPTTTGPIGGSVGPPQPVICLSQTILPVVYQAECVGLGLDVWSPFYWAGTLQTGYPRYIERDAQLYLIE